jgi:hypothetical protein
LAKKKPGAKKKPEQGKSQSKEKARLENQPGSRKFLTVRR